MNNHLPFYLANGSPGVSPAPTPVALPTPVATAPAAATGAVAPVAPPTAQFSAESLVNSLTAAITSAVTAGFQGLQASLTPSVALPATPVGSSVAGVVQNSLVGGTPAPPTPPILVTNAVAEAMKRPGMQLAMALQAHAYAGLSVKKTGNFTSAPDRAKVWGESNPVRLSLQAEANGSYNLSNGQTTRDVAAGGALVPHVLSSDFIQFLREKAKVRSAGARVVENLRGVLEIARGDGGTSAGYTGEGQPSIFSTMAFGNIMLVSKKLQGLVSWTWESANRPVFDLVDLVISDAVDAMALTEDSAFLRSDGAGGREPQGIAYQMATANRLTATTGWAAGDDNVRARIVRGDRSRMKLLLRKAFIEDDGTRVWFINPTVWEYLSGMQSTLAQLIFPETEKGMWGRIPVKETTLLPDDLPSSTSELMLVQMSQVLIADESPLRVETSDSFTTTFEGATKTLADLDRVGTKLTTLHDLGLRRSKAAAMITNCPWRL